MLSETDDRHLRWPFLRKHVLAMPEELTDLRERTAPARVSTPDGEPAWLVTRYDQVKALYADERLGWRRPSGGANEVTVGEPVRDEEEGGRSGRGRGSRPPLTTSFSFARMRSMATHIQDITDGLLADLHRMPTPADIHSALSLPLPSQVIAELLGVPTEDRDGFNTLSRQAANWVDREGAVRAMEEFTGYMAGIVEGKRSALLDDVLSDLIRAQDSGRLDAGQVARVAIGLLFAGHQTTVARIDIGILLFLTNPEQRARLVEQPDLIDSAVEEILRMASPNGGGGLPRYALEDLDVGGAQIRTGDRVILAASSANRDRSIFADPDAFDIARDNTRRHLSFGYGPKFCCGADVARMELRSVFSTLFTKFPDLRLQQELAEIPSHPEAVLGGIERLLVSW